MTLDEAIAIIRKEYLCVDRDCDIEKNCGRCDLMMPSKEPILEAYKMAIQALEQEPTVTSTEDNAEMIYPQVEGITPTVALPDVDKDFQIGDEVRIIGSDPIYDDCDVGWVIRNASERVKTMYVMRNDGSADEENKAEWYKTGRHNAMLAEVIKQLPSVKPQTGQWIRITNGGAMKQIYLCSVCHRQIEDDGIEALITIKYPYCHCGAKMEVEQHG